MVERFSSATALVLGCLAAGAIALVLAGCGGGSDSAAIDAGTTSGSTKSAPSPSGSKREDPGHRRSEESQSKANRHAVEKAVEDERDAILRKAGGPNGVEVDADSPVARKILESLSKQGSRKHGKGEAGPVEKAVGKILNPPQGGGDSGGESGGESGSVTKILEQLGK